MYKVVKTGSMGNAVIYHKSIMVDCGVTYASLLPYIHDLQIVLFSHAHKDHLNLKTIKKLAFERPALRFGCGEFMKEYLTGIKNLDIYEAGFVYDYGNFKISPVILYHDVPNFGFRIYKGDTKILHCTDTAHLNGITAKNYDLYAIEHNYNEDTVFETIENKSICGQFAHEKASINSHMSEQQARDFIFKNAGKNSKTLRLHESQILKTI